MKSLVNKLKSMGWRISVAESCTGGTVSKMITDVPGASSVFDMAVTTYSNEAKIKLLNVKPETLAEFGAVSEETAREMASGVKSLSGANIALSVTGIAGPDSDGTAKPVGMVCIGVATDERCYASTFLFTGSRAEIRRLSARMALKIALNEIGGVEKKEKIKLFHRTNKRKSDKNEPKKKKVKKTLDFRKK